MPEAKANGLKIHYDDLGRGEPALLCLPGWCANRSVFRDLAARCAAQRHVLSLDWRGHGTSETPKGDFGVQELIRDALAVIESSGAPQIVPVALAHAGWVALDLCGELKERIPKLVFIEWIVTEAPMAFQEALKGMQLAERWKATVNGIFDLWLHGVKNPALDRFVRSEMGQFGFARWSRAARKIQAYYAKNGSPLRAMARMKPPIPTLHLCVPPHDPQAHHRAGVLRGGAPLVSVPDSCCSESFPNV